MKNLPVKEVKFYQAIKLEGASVTFVTPSAYLTVKSNKKEIGIELVDHGVVLSTDRELVMVGWPNIAYITFDAAAPAASSASSKKAK